MHVLWVCKQNSLSPSSFLGCFCHCHLAMKDFSKRFGQLAWYLKQDLIEPWRVVGFKARRNVTQEVDNACERLPTHVLAATAEDDLRRIFQCQKCFNPLPMPPWQPKERLHVCIRPAHEFVAKFRLEEISRYAACLATVSKRINGAEPDPCGLTPLTKPY